MARFIKKLGKKAKQAVEDVIGDAGDQINKVFSKESDPEEGDKGGHSAPGQTLLHGQLEIEIHSATGLPDTDNIFFGIGKLLDAKDVTDPFVTGWLGTNRILMTSVRDNTMDPTWEEKFVVPVCHMVDTLVLDVRDKDHAWTEAIGKVAIDVHEILEGSVEGGRDILDSG